LVSESSVIRTLLSLSFLQLILFYSSPKWIPLLLSLTSPSTSVVQPSRLAIYKQLPVVFFHSNSSLAEHTNNSSSHVSIIPLHIMGTQSPTTYKYMLFSITPLNSFTNGFILLV
jgi:hypothetical protein